MKYHIKRIAVATDFSPETSHALEHAVVLAKKHHARLDIIHAVEPARIGKAERVAAAYENLKKIKSQLLSDHEIEARVYARMDGVTNFIYKYCVDNKTDLLVIGVQTHVKRYFGESKTYEIIKKIECPVLSIPVSFKKYHFGRILYPVRDVRGVEEKLLYSRPFIYTDSSELRFINFGQEGAETMRELIETASKDDVNVEVINYSGNQSPKTVSAKIIELARREDDDMIVINATSEKEWYRVFGENYTEYILKEADIAVLSITHAFESAGQLN